jgi:hypothetical protein
MTSHAQKVMEFCRENGFSFGFPLLSIVFHYFSKLFHI